MMDPFDIKIEDLLPHRNRMLLVDEILEIDDKTAVTSASGSAADGALFMVFFGLGTLPAVLTAGILSHWIARLSKLPQVRRGAGFFVIILAVLTLFVSSSTDHAHYFHFFHRH